MSVRYRAKQITPVDVVMWRGDNLEEMQIFCPDITVSHSGMVLQFTSADMGIVELFIGELLMKNAGTGKFSKLSQDVFVGLYEPQ
jgi:hypothetical protein